MLELCAHTHTHVWVRAKLETSFFPLLLSTVMGGREKAAAATTTAATAAAAAVEGPRVFSDKG